MFSDILDNSAGEFEDTEEVYEAVGEVLQGISEKSEKDIRYSFSTLKYTLLFVYLEYVLG